MNRKPRRNETDWGDEVAGSVGLIGKIFGKILSFILSILLTILLVGMITGTIVGGAFALYIKNHVEVDLDGFEYTASNQDMTTKIYYMDYTDRTNRIGTPIELEEQRIYGAQNRIWAPYSSMPKYLTDAFVAVEDKRFYKHGGVDWLRTGSAVLNWVIGGSSRYGGSTLTQQLIKNVTGDDDVTPQRKIQEMLRAIELEKTKDKSQIIELYLNTIFLSQRSYGVKAAANTYFGKEVNELTLIECAALAAIPQFPTRYDPYQYPENNQERRDVILELMLEEKLITKQEFELAYKRELKLNMQSIEVHTYGTNSWYQDQVIDDAVTLLTSLPDKNYTREIASNMIYTQGLQIYTVMDPYVQNLLEEIFMDNVRLLGEENSNIGGLIDPECAMVIIDPYTGDVLGLIGGRGEKVGNRIFNYATQGKRPPGSSIKPVSVYAPGLEFNAITYGSAIDDVPFNFGDDKTNPKAWPKNLPERYGGLTPIQDAVKRSVNTVAVRVLDKITPQRSFDFLTNQLSIDLVESREIGGGKYVTDIAPAPLALGELSYGLTVEELTAAYAIFVNKGVFNEPRTIIKILDNEGNVIVDNSGTGTVVISEATATIMTKMLQGVVQDGTGSRVSLKNTIDVAGKTGTTMSDNDRWFMGYTPYYVAGLWFGYAMPKTLANTVTSSISSIIWNNVMTELHQQIIIDSVNNGTPLKKFVDASNVITKQYCMDSGMIPGEACKMDLRGSRIATGYFTQATAPAQICNVHVIVDYDLSTGSVASPNCLDTVKRSLIRVTTRNFPVWVNVVDAEFTYRDVPAGVSMSMVSNEPFYMNAMPVGSVPGRSGTDTPANRYCKTHHSDTPMEPIEEPADEEPLPEPPPPTDEVIDVAPPDTPEENGEPDDYIW